MGRTQLVILKADDIREHPQETLSRNWSQFIEIIRDRDLKAGLGLIGDSLEHPSDAYVDCLVELSKDGRFQIWDHGYDHHLKKEAEDGTVYSEFRNTSLDHQQQHLAETQRLAQERLELTLTTFGAPSNAIDDNTCQAVDEIEDLTVWLYGDARSNAHILERSINIEQPTHYPNFEGFRNDYSPDIPVPTLQLHLSSWDEDRFTNFHQILDALADRDTTFINPVEILEEASS